MEIRYRQALADDIQDIETLITKAIAHMKENGIEQWDELYPTKDDFMDDIRNNQLTVGCIENQIAVVFTINQAYDEEYENGKWKEPEKSFNVVHRLCVHPKFQNMGIARQAMDYIEKQTLSEGKRAVRLDVYSKNTYANKLYLGRGYQKVGEVEWRKGCFYLMEKYLD
ncbi:MAG: GNAT family N-acetyltransferase [Lachnospiraceae bacterium]|nr:GNAT family N-acetyltransferase [Lachnospiraceae bacterium]